VDLNVLKPLASIGKLTSLSSLELPLTCDTLDLVKPNASIAFLPAGLSWAVGAGDEASSRSSSDSFFDPFKLNSKLAAIGESLMPDDVLLYNWY
jgi:hypothetical protein